MVKAERGRRRYVYLETEDGQPASQEDFLHAVISEASRRGLKTVKLIQFNGSKGIVRCNQPEVGTFIDLVNDTRSRHGVRTFRTLRTSGTLRTLRDRYFPEEEHSGRRKG